MLKLKDLLKEADGEFKCPVATQNGEVNIENRQVAIDRYGYGPLNPNNPNIKFWKKSRHRSCRKIRQSSSINHV